jgi:hypothetical protein
MQKSCLQQPAPPCNSPQDEPFRNVAYVALTHFYCVSLTCIMPHGHMDAWLTSAISPTQHQLQLRCNMHGQVRALAELNMTIYHENMVAAMRSAISSISSTTVPSFARATQRCCLH